MEKARLIAVVVVLVLAAVFIFENLSHKVDVQFLSLKATQISASVVILVSVAVGFLAGTIAWFTRARRTPADPDSI